MSETQKSLLWLTVLCGGVLFTKWAIAPVLLVLLVFPSLRQSIFDTVLRGLEEKDALLIRILVFCVPVIFYVVASPAPPDDLLREMTAGLHHYDYRNLYWGSPRLMAGDTSYWWSRATEWLLQVLPPQEAFLPVQYALVLGWAIALPLSVRKAIRLSEVISDNALAWAVTGILVSLIWADGGFVSRMIQARPENLGALLVLFAFLASGFWLTALWTLTATLFVPMYWLSAVYIPGALLLDIPGRKRFLVFGGLSLEFLVVWVSGLQGNWWGWFTGMPIAIAHRVVGISENEPLWHFLLGSNIWLFIALAILVTQTPAIKARQWRFIFFLLVIWYALPDMVRYIDDILPLVVLLIAVSLRPIPESLRKPIFLLAPVAIFFLATSSIHTSSMADMKIPGAKPGQRVLTTLGPAEYWALYQNPELKFAPACELGYTKKAIQEAGLGLYTGKTTCKTLYQYRVSWVVGKGLDWKPNTLGKCLRLIRMNAHGYGIWKVASHG